MGRTEPTPKISPLEERALNHFLNFESRHPDIALHRLRISRKSRPASDIIGNLQEEYAYFSVGTFLQEFGGILYDLQWARKKGSKSTDVVRIAIKVLRSLGYTPTHDRKKKIVSFPSRGSESFKQIDKQVIRDILGDRLNEFYYVSEMQHIYYYAAY